jgi:hypothetical protein
MHVITVVRRFNLRHFDFSLRNNFTCSVEGEYWCSKRWIGNKYILIHLAKSESLFNVMLFQRWLLLSSPPPIPRFLVGFVLLDL